MWNIFIIVICVIAFVFNSYLWFVFRKENDKEIRGKQGWNGFYLISTFLILIVLMTRIGKL